MKLPLNWNLRNPLWLITLASAWMATAANGALWRELGTLALLDSPAGWAFGAALSLIIALALMALLCLLAWRWTLKPALTFLLLAAAFGAHFMLSYRVVIDATMMVNVLQTNPAEAADLLSLRLGALVLVLGVLPVAVVWRTPLDYGRWPRRLLHNLLGLLGASALLVAVLLASFQPLSSTMRNHKQVRYLMNPLNSVYALGYLAAQPLRRDESIMEAIGQDARLAPAPAGARPPLLVLVLGETGRSGNFSLNGYARPTNTELAREDVASWRNAWSCGTSTAASVPCMFSHLGRSDFESRPHNYEGLLDVLQRAGLAVLWLDNQSGCKGTCERVPHADTSHIKNPALCTTGECLDGIMLEGLDERLAALPAERRARGVVLVLHQMGSHGPAYWQRSPEAYKRFLPECRTVDLQRCSREQVVNAYDNSIAYTDHFLASTIGWLKGRESSYDAAMVYVADHGESLGENNLYLHGLPYAIAPDVQKHVPWITWLSTGFARRSGLSTECLRKEGDAQVSHDNYFHSVLGLMGVQTQVYQRALDPYARCARP
ncbi:MAG: phosphoethanolamine--lipid A transferase [Ramlibacter sp.]|nr:phosphoethanolamine--lipid A transferase [Ramlibacter sp.]